MKSEADLYLERAQEYLRAAEIVFQAEVSKDWENRNPIYFLLLHSAELGLKSLGKSRGLDTHNSHDLVVLLRTVTQTGDRIHFRRIYRKLVELRLGKIHSKFVGSQHKLSQAAIEVETASMRYKPLGLAHTFRLLGVLGQSEMTKIEFGKEIKKYWHSVRYPRFGITTYPEYHATFALCAGIIEVSQHEREKASNSKVF